MNEIKVTLTFKFGAGLSGGGWGSGQGAIITQNQLLFVHCIVWLRVTQNVPNYHILNFWVAHKITADGSQ